MNASKARAASGWDARLRPTGSYPSISQTQLGYCYGRWLHKLYLSWPETVLDCTTRERNAPLSGHVILTKKPIEPKSPSARLRSGILAIQTANGVAASRPELCTMPLLLPRDNQRPFQNKTSGKTNLPNSHNCCQSQQTSWVTLLEGTTKDHDLFLSAQVVPRPLLRLHPFSDSPTSLCSVRGICSAPGLVPACPYI
jgi:hypothetical protein